MAPPVDTAFIRRAVELAEPSALRAALYQLTRDPRIAGLPLAVQMSDEDRRLLQDVAVEWLEKHAGPRPMVEPPEDELREIMDFATSETMDDLKFEARRDLPAFRPFPLAAAKPEGFAVPPGFRVAIIGSGFSGIAMAIQLAMLDIPYVVFERRAEAGGTWSINRYPDIRVDTPSISYDYCFEKGHRWSEYFARGAEVRGYLEGVARKYGVTEHIRFQHDLRSAVFDETRDLWQLELDTPEGVQAVDANVLVSATGLFANPRIVRFEGQQDFAGPIIHPSRWPSDVDLAGKRVAIIGNGSTGVQLLAPIAREAAQVHVFQRTRQWIAPRPRYGQPIEPEMRWLLDNLPTYWNWGRYMTIAPLFESHDMVIPDPEWQAAGGKISRSSDKLRDFLTDYIRTKTAGRPDLTERLIPDYAPFSRRPVVDNGWYEALGRDNVELVTDGIARFTGDGIETEDGQVRPVDVIITATGFDIVQFLAPARWIGRGGADLHARWQAGDGPRAYLGMTVPDFPNMFMLYGPNSQLVSGGTTLPVWFVVWAAYVGKCIMGMVGQGGTSIEATHAAHDAYNAALDEEAKRVVHLSTAGGVERNYYVNNDHGRLQVNAPWESPLFHAMCTKVDWGAFEIGAVGDASVDESNRMAMPG